MNLKSLSILFLAITLFACQNTKKKSDPSQQLSIGVMSSMDYLPLVVAQKKGYFTENGIDVTLQKFFSANDRDAALQSGNLDGTILDYTGGAIQRAGGEKIKFASQCDGTFELLVGKTSGISSLNDLTGKNIAVSRNTVIDFCTDAALQQAEINQANVTKSEINKIPLRLEMLSNARIDATMLPDPFATIAKAEGNTSVISMAEMGYKVTGIAFLESSIAKKSEAIKKFYIAYNKAINDLLTNPIEDFHTILVEDIGFPEEVVKNVQLPAYTNASLPSEQDLLVTDKWLKEKNLVPSDFDIRSLVAPGLIP